MEWLSIAEFCYNNHVQTSTRASPFFLNFGRHPRTGLEVSRQSSVEAADVFVKRLWNIHERAVAALEKATVDMKHFADAHRQSAPEYKVGDKVWLDASNLRTSRPSKKLDDRRFGPFSIIQVVSPHVYRLQLPRSWRMHPVFHTSKLRPYISDSSIRSPQPSPPLPVVMNEEVEYEVESILDSRFRRGLLQYLVHWKGYPREDDTWEPASHLTNSSQLVEIFHQQNPLAPKR